MVEYLMYLLLKSVKVVRRQVQIRQLRLQRYGPRLRIIKLYVFVANLELSSLQSPGVRRDSSEHHQFTSQRIGVV